MYELYVTIYIFMLLTLLYHCMKYTSSAIVSIVVVDPSHIKIKTYISCLCSCLVFLCCVLCLIVCKQTVTTLSYMLCVF